MSTASSFDSVRSAARFTASLPNFPLPLWLRNAILIFYVPKLLEFITSRLQGESLGSVSREKAGELLPILQQLHAALSEILTSWDSASPLMRLVFRRWMRRVKASTDEIAEIIETLAWSLDGDLRGVIDSAVAEITQANHQ